MTFDQMRSNEWTGVEDSSTSTCNCDFFRTFSLDKIRCVLVYEGYNNESICKQTPNVFDY